MVSSGIQGNKEGGAVTSMSAELDTIYEATLTADICRIVFEYWIILRVEYYSAIRVIASIKSEA